VISHEGLKGVASQGAADVAFDNVGHTSVGDRLEKGRLPGIVENGHPQIYVARALLRQQIKAAPRLHVDTAPAAIVEELGHRSIDRMICTDINIEADLLPSEYPVQQDVFVVLRI
jgi:hypothetical protein